MNPSTDLPGSAPKTPTHPNQTFRGLDGLRAVAFLLVFCFHAGYLRFGWMGVQVFFVISGFLITDILLRMKDALPAREYFLKFYARRFLRIFPLYYFFLFAFSGLAAGLASIHYKPHLMEALLAQVKFALLYVFNFAYATKDYADLGVLDHLWSLSVEEQFYLVWPLLVLLVPRRHLRRFFMGGAFAGLFFRALIFLIVKMQIFPFLRTSPPLVVYFMTFSHVDAFSFGAYISRFPLPRAKTVFALLCAAIPLVGILTRYADTGLFEAALALGYDILMPGGYQFIWAYGLLNYFFMHVVYIVVKEKTFAPFLDFAPMRYLGRISYGLYVYHYPVFWLAGEAQMRFEWLSDAGAHTVNLICFLATLALAAVSYRALEAPFLKLKDRFSYTTHAQG